MEKEKLSPMLKQYFDLKKKHPDALLLFRCGDFLECYFKDAENAAKILGITLTHRSRELFDGKPTPMAGFPYHALDTYLPKLIRAGHRVAICDQLEDPKTKTVKRGVSELVSPQAEKEKEEKEEVFPDDLPEVPTEEPNEEPNEPNEESTEEKKTRRRLSQKDFEELEARLTAEKEEEIKRIQEEYNQRAENFRKSCDENITKINTSAGKKIEEFVKAYLLFKAGKIKDKEYDVFIRNSYSLPAIIKIKTENDIALTESETDEIKKFYIENFGRLYKNL